MRDLTAQVTSSLMQFPEVTVDALGEDEITLDSVLHGKFTLRRSGLAWLACGPQLEVVNSVTGARFSAHRFSSVNEHPPSVLVARDFCWLKRTGLLVGLEEAEGSVLCLYDLGISRVVKAVVIPGRITGIEPLVSYGGASASTQHLHQSLRWFFGVVAVVTDVGHVLLVDLCLDDLSCSQSEQEASDLEVVNRSPAEIPRIRESVTRQGRHLCLQLSSPTGSSATALQYITRTNQLAVGFSDGYLQLWNMKMLKKEYHSQLEGGRVAVYAFTFQEPENDPRNCCYLWAVQSAQDYEGDVVSLHLLQLAFGERKCLASGKILYEGLEYCEERYSQDLNGTAFPLRAQATSTRLLGCQTIEKFRHHPDRDDSMNEGASPDTSVSIFSWQVKSYGQSKPSTYIGVFDINRWYHAQMPDSLRAGESLHSCPYLAVWSMDPVLEMASPGSLLDVLVHERSLSRGLPHTSPTPEQFFNPTTYNFDATCLLNSGVVHFTCSGYQKETLSFLKRSASCLSETITDSYSRCLMSGLLSSRLADVQPSNLSKEDQLDAILSTAVESSTLGLITGCLKQWTAEDQPRSAVNLRYILEWAWDKVVVTKEELDGICAPLFDSSSNFTDPQTLQLLQHSQRLLGNLSTIFHCLLSEAQDVTHKGLVSLINKNMVSGLIAQYAQVVLWFCRTGLLPEGADDDMLQISKPFYNYSVIKNYYTGRREDLRRLSRGKWSSDCLMIDGLVAQFGERLGDLWKRDEGGTGRYPPPTLHALLDIYLLENIEESAKHAIVIYLLLDVMYSYPNKSGTSVESFPTAFAIPISLVKLVQGLWLLDHHDHENSLELLLHPSTSRSLWTWQHERVLQALMCQDHHGIALRYLHTMKPHMTSTSQVKLCLTVLLHNRCMVEAWSHLRQHSNKLNAEEMLRFLYEVCQELGLMKELLKLPLGFAEQEVLEKFLQGSGGLQNRELLMVHYLQQANYVPALQLNQALKMNLVNDRDPRLKERSNTRNSILEQYGKVLPRVQRRLATERAKPYHHPSTILREVSRPRPLSTVAKRSATENVLTRATFISNVLSKIGEVWVGKDGSPDSSPLKSPRVPELPVTMPRHPLVDLPEAFIGTPISVSCKRSSRIIDLVIHPSSQMTPEAPCLQQTPPRRAGAGSISSPGSYVNKPNELRLLQTPQVVKRARALAASGPMFSSFTPQSILRSNLRPTPVASPSASPGRSASPLPRPKESRITFIEEAPTPELVKGPVHWSSKIAGDGEISLLSRSSPLPEPAVEEEEEEQHLSYISPSMEDHPPEKAETGRDREKESESCSLVRESMSMAPMPVAGRISLGLETSQLSIQSVDTTLEFHDAPLPEDLMEEPQDKAKNLEPVAPDVTPLPSGNANERKWPAAEISLGAEGEDQGPAQEVAELEPDLEPAQEVAELEPDLEPAQEVAELEPDLEPAQEVAELAPDLEPAQEVAELAPDLEPAQKVAELAPDLEPAQEVAELAPDLEPAQEVAELAPDLEPAQEVAELAPDLEPAQEVAELAPDLEPAQEVAELAPDLEPAQEVAELEPDLEPAQEVAELEPDLEPAQEVAELEPDLEPAQEVAELEPDLEPAQEVAELEPDLEPAQEVAELEPDLEPAQEVAEPIEHMGLDEFVEQHLFGDDISLTRSSIREASQTWASFSNSGSFCDDGEKVEADVFNPPTSMTQTSVASTSSRATDSHSVVSLDNSGEFSSAVSEEDLEVASEDDSGSEVEIIKEVEGIGRQQVSQNADVFLLETHGSEYLDEPAPAVLLSASPECFYVKKSEEEEANVMLNLEAVNQVHEENDGTTDFIEPSAPPPALLEQSELVVRAPVLKECIEPEHPLPETCGNFTLFLEAEEGDSGSVLDGHPLCVESNWEMDSVVLPGENDLRQEQVLVQELNNSLDGTDQVVHEDLPLPTSLPDISEPVSRTFTGQIAGKNTTEDKAEESEAGEMSQPDVSEAVKLPCLSTVHTAEKESSNVAEPFGTEEEAQFKETSVMTDEQKLTTDSLPSPLIDKVAPAVFVIQNDFQVAQMELDGAFEEEPDQIEEAIKLTEANSDTESKTMKGQDTQLVEEMKEPPSAKRRTTRQRKTVSFPSPIEEAEREETPFPLTPRRSTRSGKHGQNSQVHLTPRKVTSVSDLQPQMVEEVVEPQTPKKSTPRKGTRRTKNAAVVIEDKVAEESSKESALLMTPTRSTRKTKAAHIEVPETGVIEHGKLNDQPAKVPSSPGRVTRKSSRGISLALEVSQLRPQEEAMFERVSVTPKRGARKTRAGKVEKDENGEAGVEELPPLNSSRRSMRSQLWNHLESSEKKEDECPLLETSLAVEPGMQLADALMERLKDTEGGKGENSVGSVHSNVVTKPAGDQIPSLPPSLAEAPERLEEPQTDAQVFEAEPAEKPEVRWIESRTPKRGRSTRASKVPESHTFVFSPPQTRRRTKGRKADYPVQNDDGSAPHFAFSPPTTRARRPASMALSQTVNDEDKHEIGLDVPEVQTEAAKPEAVKPRRKQTAKPKAVALVPSPVKINLISPAASPAEPAPVAQKRREETEAPPQRMNLRRKRLLDSIFPKPVTRRKML